MIRPQNGLMARRIAAKADTTAEAAKLLTPKCLANTGNTGTRTPKPTATENATIVSTSTSRGIEVRLRSHERGEKVTLRP